MGIPMVRVMRNIAKRRHISETELRKRLECAIAETADGQGCTQQAQWGQIPHIGTLPTAEELLDYLLRQDRGWDALTETQASLYLESLLEPDED